MELLETIARIKPEEDEVIVQLITTKDEFKAPQQLGYLQKMQDSCATTGIQFSWTFDENHSIHARHIVTDKGWKILLDRGLDIFQQYEMNDSFAMPNRLQNFRPCKAFEVTFLRNESDS